MLENRHESGTQNMQLQYLHGPKEPGRVSNTIVVDKGVNDRTLGYRLSQNYCGLRKTIPCSTDRELLMWCTFRASHCDQQLQWPVLEGRIKGRPFIAYEFMDIYQRLQWPSCTIRDQGIKVVFIVRFNWCSSRQYNLSTLQECS